jgi:CheY-like chemotaxis protein
MFLGVLFSYVSMREVRLMSEEEAPKQTNQENYDSILSSIKKRKGAKIKAALIVDDEPTFRKIVAKTITAADSEVVVFEASNGMDALNRLKEIREQHNVDPLFITLDLNMPIMDGWETVQALAKDYKERGLPHGIPVVIFSATTGKKGFVFKKDVHSLGYEPLVSVAKEDCMRFRSYDAIGEKGLEAWVNFFIRRNLTRE